MSVPKEEKVLYVIGQLTAGGSERQLSLLARHLTKGKFKPIVCCLGEVGIVSDELKEAGVKLININAHGRKGFIGAWRVARIIKKEGIRILHTWLFTANTWGRIGGILANCPVIIASERGIIDFERRWYHNLIDKILAKFSSLVLVNSAAVRDYVAQMGIPREKIRIIYNGLELDKFTGELDAERAHLLRKEFNIPEGNQVVGMVARLHPHKDYITYIKAAKIVCQRKENVSFLMVGDGSERKKIENIIREHALEGKVVITGERKDVPDIIAIMDVAVLSSPREGLPNAVLEAQASRKPVVATRTTGVLEAMVDGKTGIMVDIGNAEGMAEAILTLLEDKELARRMGEEGRRWVEERFSVERMVRETERVYEELLKQKSRGSSE